MKPRAKSVRRTSLEMLEEAVHLLRSAPAGALAAYLAGSVPFLLGLLYFFADMSRNAFAGEHLLSASLTLAILFVWKNVWQAIFSARLYRTLGDADVGRPQTVRMVAIQCALQPLSMLAIPVALLCVLPFAPVVMFFRNLGLYAALGRPDAVEAARKQAALSLKQSWGVLGLITLAGLLLFVNLLVTIAELPQLGRSFLGIEGDLVRLGSGILNTTTLAVTAALSWLFLDPLLDAVCVLRCFYGESLSTGQDLLATLRRALAVAVPALVLALVLLSRVPAAHAQSPTPETPAASVDAKRLERSMSEVIRRREFTWRNRTAAEETRPEAPAWLSRLSDLVSDGWTWFKKKVWDWLFPSREEQRTGKDSPVTGRMMKWLVGAAVALAAGVGIFLWRRKRAPVVAAQAVAAAAPVIDLADESLTADQLPESSWLKLAEEWLAKGDCRLALRALYLASLNFLNQRNLVTVRRWKSGRDYRLEVERRGRAQPELAPAFSHSVAIFERGWYGRHTVDRVTVEQFAAGLEQMRGHAG